MNVSISVIAGPRLTNNASNVWHKRRKTEKIGKMKAQSASTDETVQARIA
jgi:hypothetical protein